MPGTEELMARLQQLEDGYYGDKEAERQKKFFDTYGGRFSNNHGLGLAILNELDARGVDTSAADEAVQQILDQLRTECNEIIESIKDVQNTAIENAQKVEEISNVVSEAVAANPDAASMTGGLGGEQTPMPADTSAMDTMNAPDDSGEFNPDEMAAPAPDDSGEFNPDEMAASAPDDSGEFNPDEMAAPGTTVSDERLKSIKSTFSAKRAKRINASSFKPSASMISAARGGF